MMIKAIIIDKTPDINVIEASAGQEALELAEGKEVDCFSDDYNMPNIDGIEFITKMSMQRTDSKFALLTANIQKATHKKAEQIGAKCINNPISETCVMSMLEYFNG